MKSKGSNRSFATCATPDLRTRKEWRYTLRRMDRNTRAINVGRNSTPGRCWRGDLLTMWRFQDMQIFSFFVTMPIPYFFRHMLTHTSEKLEKCPLCYASFRDKITVERHIARKHSNNPYNLICHICGKAFNIPFDLKSHIDRHEGKLQVTCDTCGEKLPDRNALSTHHVRVHGADPLVCDEW